MVARRPGGQGGNWQSHICVQINQEEQLGSEIDYATQGSCVGKESLKTSSCKKPMGVAVAGETPSLTGEFVGQTHRVPEHIQTHLPGNKHQKGPICLCMVAEVTESG